MADLDLSRDGDVFVLRMKSGENRFNPDFIGAMNAALDDAKLLGITWIRMDLSWTTIQPDGPSSYKWGAFDRVINGARARGLKVLPILTWTPDWARDAGCVRFSCPPHRPAQLTAAFEKLITDEPLRRRLGEAGRVWASRNCWTESAAALFSRDSEAASAR